MRHFATPQLSENDPLFVDLVASPDATTSGIPDNARYFQISGYADSFCDATYCESSAPNRLKGGFHFGSAVSGRHGTGFANSNEVRVDVDGRIWIKLLEKLYLVADIYGFARGRVFTSEVQLRLFLFGQEMEFNEDIGPTASVTNHINYEPRLLDAELIGPNFGPDVGSSIASAGYQMLAVYGLNGLATLGGTLSADSKHASYESDSRINLGIKATVIEPFPTLWTDLNNQWNDLVVFDLDIVDLKISNTPNASVTMQELGLGQTRYSYSVDVESDVAFLDGLLDISWFYFSVGSSVLGGWTTGNEVLLDANGYPWTTFLSESGSETIGSAPKTSRKSEVQHGVPGFWRFGVDYLYSVQFRTTIADVATDPEVREINGNLSVAHCSAKDTGRHVIRFALHATTVKVTSSLATSLDGIDKPFYMAIGPTGVIQRIWVSQALSPFVEALQRALASEFQFVRSVENHEKWTVVEEDAGGCYEATYECLSQYKYRRRSTKKSSSPAGNFLPLVEKTSDYELDNDGQLESMSSELIQQAELPGNFCLIRTTRFQAVAIDSRATCQSLPFADHRLKGSPARRVSYKRASQNAHPADPHSDKSYDYLVSALKKACELDTNDREISRIGDQLVAFFQRCRHEIVRLVGDICAVEDKMAEILIGSAAATDCTESETTLRSLAENEKLPDVARIAAIRGIVRQSSPKDKTLDLLSRLANSKESRVGRIAILSLGSAANRLSKHEEGRRITDGLINRFIDDDERASRILVLAALGNSGSDKILGVIESALEDDEWKIRAFAVSALRLVPGVRADELIANSVTKDLESEVRRSALMAMAYRNPEAHVDSIFTVLRNDSSTAVRRSALQLVEDWMNGDFPVGDLIRWVASHDCDPDIRYRAQRSLLAVNMV